ncbi:MAG: sulfotransferase [Anaerolineales bacterium]|nr:sulfotransferase [Anaerolineales bacterium]
MIHLPVLIIGCARSGTSLLYNMLSETASLWSIGYESKEIIEHDHSPAVKGWESGALAAEDLTNESRAYIIRRFEQQAAPGTYWQRVNRLRQTVNRSGLYGAIKRRGRGEGGGSAVSSAVPQAGLDAFRRLARLRNRLLLPPNRIRLLEKTPENCLRLPFLAALFPDARIIFLTRDGRANVHSLMEGWRQAHLFPGYRTPIPVTSTGQTRGRWAFTLIPGWRKLINSPLEEICAHQWVVCNQAVIDYAASPLSLPILTIRYEDLVDKTDESLARVAAFLDVDPRAIPAFGQGLPQVNVVSGPKVDKWRGEQDKIERVMPILTPMMAKLGYSGGADSSTAS